MYDERRWEETISEQETSEKGSSKEGEKEGRKEIAGCVCCPCGYSTP
jgi:hypothetical protein